MDTSKHIYFPNLDGLRFFAYLSVFFSHIIGFNNYTNNNEFYSILTNFLSCGDLGVNFFFVLSGFLITYLLLQEKKNNGTIHIGKFYMRRVLRIWPLYFLVVVFTFIILPVIYYYAGNFNPFKIEYIPKDNLEYYLLFLANFDLVYNIFPIPIIGVLWSVAVEEQFYLFWPLVILGVPHRKLPYIFLTIIIVSFLFRMYYAANVRILSYHTISVLSDLALGSTVAFYCFYFTGLKELMANLSRKTITATYIGLFLIVLFRGELFYHHDYFNAFFISLQSLIFSLFFAFIILEQNYARRSLFKVSNFPLFGKLGQLTYGLYTLHIICIFIVLLCMKLFGFHENPVDIWIFLFESIISFFVSLLVAYVSYHFFEKKFLNLKRIFAI